MSPSFLLGFALALASPTTVEAHPFIQYGTLHEALAKGRNQARVDVAELVQREHFYGVGAVEGLNGEITLLDSAAIVTAVDETMELVPLDATKAKATLLFGQSVDRWQTITVTDVVPPTELDARVGETARGHGLDVDSPFVFLVRGEVVDLRLHVIHGACPLHARMRQIDLPPEKRPYESRLEKQAGIVVGVYAEGAGGKWTHPDTNVHAHLIYDDPRTGERLTAHLEQFGLAAGATLELPAVGGGEEEASTGR